MRVLRGNGIVINWTIRRDIDGNGAQITPDEIGFIKMESIMNPLWEEWSRCNHDTIQTKWKQKDIT